MLRNTLSRFGSITKFLHWSLFALVCVQFYLIWQRSLFPKDAPEKTSLILTHKSIGITILGLAFLFWLWKAINVKPALPHQARWEYILAKIVQHSLLIIIVLMPITGFLLSNAGGRPTLYFGLFEIPAIIGPNKELAGIFDAMHETFAYLIVFLVSLHIIGALRHHFLLKDNVFKRMLPFYKGKE